MEASSFRQLRVYNEAIEWIAEIYLLLHTFPPEEKFALCSQIRRASVSVTSNIAEGTSRSSKREFAHFLEMSYGSLMEVQSQFDVALKLQYISKEEFSAIDNRTATIARMLSGLRNSILSRQE